MFLWRFMLFNELAPVLAQQILNHLWEGSWKAFMSSFHLLCGVCSFWGLCGNGPGDSSGSPHTAQTESGDLVSVLVGPLSPCGTLWTLVCSSGMCDNDTEVDLGVKPPHGRQGDGLIALGCPTERF